MNKLFLIIILVTQLGCAVVLETAAGSFIGTLSAEVMKDKLDKAKKDEVPQP
jgi:fucose permease